MQSCSSAHSVLILLLIIFITGSESAAHVVKVKYGGTAVLPCTERCTGVIRWTVFHKSTDILAKCDQTSCRSVKEGYWMIYDQYLQGDLSLIITEVDYSKRGRYSCDCDDTDKCDVELQIEGSASVVTVEYKGAAVLPCTEKCSGVVRWTLFSKSSDILAECDQTECRSVKEGYQMIYNQYLQGDFSLIITETDFRKTGWYTSDCDGRDLCKVYLLIKTLRTSVLIKADESLVMYVSDPVEVIYHSTGAVSGSSGQICTVDGGSLNCKSKYEHRTSLSSSTLELRDMKESDSGVYIISDTKNRENLYIYRVNVISKDYPVVRVDFNGTAVLNCNERCSGLVTWTPTDTASNHLAECDQTSCRSLKEGYQMIYNQYQKGNFSLIVTEADFSKRGCYTCDCDGRDLCEVQLLIEPPIIPVQIQSGGSLVMELDVSDPVEVIHYNTGSAAGFSGQICTVIGGSLQCKPEYEHRTSLLSSSTLELRDMKESDSGVYTVQDTKNKEDVHIYTVTVTGSSTSALTTGLIIVIVLLLLLMGGMVVGLGVMFWQKIKEIKKLEKEYEEQRKTLCLNIEVQEPVDSEGNVFPL